MAFTKTPMQSTSETQTVELMYGWDNRADSVNTTDTILKNALLEPVREFNNIAQMSKQYYHVQKRNGTEVVALSPQPSAGSVILGIYYWGTIAVPMLIVVYITAGPQVVVAGYNATTLALIFGPTALSSAIAIGDSWCYFQEFLYQNGNIDLLIGVRDVVYQITQAGPWTVAGPIANAGGLAGLLYFDGYAVSSDGKNLLNSNLNDPTTWSPSNFLAVDSYSGPTYKLARSGAYIVAITDQAIQYFYDAANATGTPFGTVPGATKHIGYLTGWAQSGDDAYFIGQASNSPPALYHLKGLQVDLVASLPFSRFVDNQQYNQAVQTNSNFNDGVFLNLQGHNCYFVRTPSAAFSIPPGAPPTSGASYVYDLDTGTWSKIGYQALDYYLIKSATIFSSAAGVPFMTYISVLGDGFVYRLNPNVYQDNGTNFEVKFQTPVQDFGTRRLKFGSRLLIHGDQTSSSSLLNVSWTDDDYKTFSTARQLDLVNSFQPLYSLGSFRKRSFVLSYSDNFPMRWRQIELDYDQGQM